MLVKTRKKIIGAILGGLICLGVAWGVGRNLQAPSSVSADEYKIVFEEEISDSYYLDTEIDLSSAKVEYESNQYTAESIAFVFPDGNMYSGTEFTLSQLGRYEIVCRATVQGKTVKASKFLNAYDAAYTVTQDGSSRYTDKISMVSERDTEGIEVTLNDGSMFTYNKSANLGDLPDGQPFIVLYPQTCSQILNADPLAMDSAVITVVRLTDKHDSSNYVDFDISWDALNNSVRGDYRDRMYFRAGASNQRPTGLMLNTTGEVPRWYKDVWYEGVRYNGYIRQETIANIYGPYGANWKPANSDDQTCDNMGIGLCFDQETGDVHVEFMGEDKRIFVTNLYSKEIYNSNDPARINGAPFQGFTTGDVVCSIYGTQFLGSQLKVDVTSIFNDSGEDLDVEFAIDTKAPDVDFVPEKEVYVVAKGEEISIPQVSGYDVNGVAKSTYSVYYEYGTAQQALIRSSNHRFTPNNVGNYSIVYSVKDVYGNEKNLEVKLVCKNITNNSVISFSFAEEVDTFNPAITNETFAGTQNKLPSVTLKNTNGDLQHHCKVYYAFEGSDEKTEIDANTLEFMFERVGNYKLIYEYGDSLHNLVKEFTVTSKLSTVPGIEQPVLPEYFIKGANVTLDVNRVILYGTGDKQYVQADVYKSENGGSWVKLDDFPTVKATESGNIKLQYRYGDVEVYTTDEIPVVDVNFGNKLNLINYFQGDVNVTADTAQVNFSVKENKTYGEFAFINILSYSNFSLEFIVNEQSADYGEFVIEFIDYYDRNNRTELIFKQKGNGALVVAYGGNEYDNSKVFADKHSLSYDQGSFIVNKTTYIKAPSMFSTDKVLVHFSVRDLFKESTGNNASVGIRFLCSQKISEKQVADTTKGYIVSKEMSGVWEKDSIVTIQYPDAIDMLSPFVQSGWAVTVQHDSGSVVTELISGNKLENVNVLQPEFKFKLDKYGTYNVSYQYTDQAGNIQLIVNTIYVTERETPQIKVDGVKDGESIKGKLGEVKVLAYTVTDNLSQTENVAVRITVVDPALTLTDVTEEKTITLVQKGTYTVYYTAVDEASNMSVFRYKIVVE